LPDIIAEKQLAQIWYEENITSLSLYNPVYTIQPVVKPVDNWLYNRFDNRLYCVNKHPIGCQTGCQTGLTTGLTTVLNEQLFVQPVAKPGCTTGLTTGCIVYTNIYPVVKPV